MISSFVHGGSRVVYESMGEGSPVLLMHGLAADRNQVLALFGGVEGFQWICPDLPAHGDSSFSACGFADYAAVGLSLLNHLGVRRAVIGGISMGSAIALRMAQEAPDRIKALLLIRPAWLDGPALPHLGIMARIGDWLAGGVQTAAQLLHEDGEFAAILRDNPAAARSIEAALHRPQAVSAADVLSLLVQDRPFSNRQKLVSVGCPALVVGNLHDPLHPFDIAQTLADSLPHGRLSLQPPRYLEPEAHMTGLRLEVATFLDTLTRELPTC